MSNNTKPGVKRGIPLEVKKRGIHIQGNSATVTLTYSGTAPGTTTPNSDVSFNQIPLYLLPHKACKPGIGTATSTTTRFDLLTQPDMKFHVERSALSGVQLVIGGQEMEQVGDTP